MVVLPVPGPPVMTHILLLSAWATASRCSWANSNPARLTAQSTAISTFMGGKDDAKGFMPLFEQDNDGILTVAAAKQNGAREEYLALNKTHFFLHQDNKILELVLSFLNTGRFGRGMRIRKEQSYTNLWDR